MTINTTTNKARYIGNGATTVFSYGFLIPSASDLGVYYTDPTTGITTLLASNLYTVTGLGNAGGGTVTYPLTGSPIAASAILVILRTLPYTQEVDLINQDGFYPAVVEDGLDTLEMQIQQLIELEDRNLRVGVTDTTPGTLPSAAERALKLLGFDSAGTAIAAEPSSALVSSAMMPVVAAATLALARAAMGLGNASVGTVGYGLQIGVSNAGQIDANTPVTADSTNQSVTKAFHESLHAATGPITYALPKASTLWNGFGFYIYCKSGRVNLTIDAADNFTGYTAGLGYDVPQRSWVKVQTDGAGSGTWYVTPQSWNNGRIPISGATVIDNRHNGATLDCAGAAFYVLDFLTNIATLDPNFTCMIVNTEAASNSKAVRGVGNTFFLYQNQSFLIFKNNGVMQVLGGNAPTTGGVPKRRPWTAIALYVDTVNGSDDPLVSDGMSTGARAYKTLQAAYNAVNNNFDAQSSYPIITCTGVTSETVTIAGTPVGAGSNALFINGASPGAFQWKPAGTSGACMFVGDGGTIQISNIHFLADGVVGFTSGLAIQMHQYSIIDINGGCKFGAFGTGAGQHIGTDGAGWTINISASYTVDTVGGVNIHMNLGPNGVLNHAGGITVTITNTPTISGYWFRVSGSGCNLNMGGGVTWSGGIVAGCTKWLCLANSLLSLGGNAANVPGSIAGAPAVANAPATGLGMVLA